MEREWLQVMGGSIGKRMGTTVKLHHPHSKNSM
jgi:hypothetical protein